jgi:endonuclease G
MIAFIIPNENSMKTIKEFIVSVDSLESMTGVDFFPSLPNSIESVLESKVDLSGWR